MIAGREREIAKLTKILHSKKSEFLAAYGRRRIGKTYLLRKFFQGQDCIFASFSGQLNTDLDIQLQNFTHVFKQTFAIDLAIQTPKNWNEAMYMLESQIKATPPGKKFVILFDEISWLASAKSGFLEALDYCWNNVFSKYNNVKLIVCGSVASWILDNIINATGGLHNRLTGKIHLQPFTLKETTEFLKYKGLRLNDQNILELYMTFGGIPYYLEKFSPGKSAAEIVDELMFSKDSDLYDEFERLFKSLFHGAETHIRIVETLAGKVEGFSRQELLQKLEKHSGGRFNAKLDELETAGFIKSFIPYGKKVKDKYYKLLDEYSLFYLYWVKPILAQGQVPTKNFWVNNLNTGKYYNWRGLAFEVLCYRHLEDISKSLKITKLISKIGSFKTKDAQVDLLLERTDGAINLCEIKYSDKPFTITKEYAVILKNKMMAFLEKYPKKQVFLTIITAFGFQKNLWSADLVDSNVTIQKLLG